MQNYDFFKNEADVKKYAWYEGNSDDRTHPVGLLEPIMIDGKDFYDLYGNVSELGWDGHSGLRYHSGKNPMVVPEMDMQGRVIVGGSLRSNLNGSVSPFNWLYFEAIPSNRASDIGFRLVRTIEQGNGEQSGGE